MGIIKIARGIALGGINSGGVVVASLLHVAGNNKHSDDLSSRYHRKFGMILNEI